MRAIVPSGAPMLAATATVTKFVRDDIIDKLEMKGCEVVFVSPNRSNIYYEVRPRTEIEQDMHPILENLRCNKKLADRVVVYCRSYNMCAELYQHFLCTLGDDSYYPPGAEKISDNRLFGMFHAGTPDHNKEVILSSMREANGVVRVVFATVALGMGLNFVGLNNIVHYGAPSSIEDYFQESGRAGRSGDQAKSVIFWKPRDAPMKQDLSNPRNAEVAAVRRYLDNNKDCRRCQLLRYFDPSLPSQLSARDHLLCCDVCASTVTSTN